MLLKEIKKQVAKSSSAQCFLLKLKNKFNQNEIVIKTDGTKKKVICKNALMLLTQAE